MALLRKGRLIGSDLTGKCYKLVSDKRAEGGFGEIYQAVELDKRRNTVREVAVKVGLDSIAWHGEAYFGRLLKDQDYVVQLHDAFQLTDGRGQTRQVKYILVFDWMADGTVEQVLSRNEPAPWPERTVTRQTANLLRVLVLLHNSGICHGDITPGNVFVDGHRLLLGDLGIAKQALGNARVSLNGAAPPIFMPPDACPSSWSPADDTYQIGLIALSLLSGEVMTTRQVCGRALRSLRASDHMKGWIREAVKRRQERFRDSEVALSCLLNDSIAPVRSPKSLRGQRVVFTGTLPVKREIAKRRARRAGAVVQPKVNGQTTLVVAGQPNPLMIGQRRGTKLFDAHRLIRQGQRIAIIGAKRFETLLTRGSSDR